MPYIQAVYEEIAPEELSMLAINMGEPKSTVQEFVKREGLTFPIALDYERQVPQDYGIRYIPTTFFIDREGIIRQVKIGAFKDKAEILANLEGIR